MKNGQAGVYKLYDINKTIIYIGMSTNDLYNRARRSILDKQADYIQICKLDNQSDSMMYELLLIDKYKPSMNKCTASKCNTVTSLNINEPLFDEIQSVHNFINRHELPSIMHAKIYNALRHKIVQPNPYTDIASALIFNSCDHTYTVVLYSGRINNIFLDMLYRNGQPKFLTNIDVTIDIKSNLNKESICGISADMFTADSLSTTVDYNMFIPFNEAHSINILIIKSQKDFELLTKIFNKEGHKVWN